ncbi:unnamed protein product [Peniophora sp. CBMAI 1063]|nr:unnamed protein product [Peniophora sp. CBMAI 1063]
MEHSPSQFYLVTAGGVLLLTALAYRFFRSSTLKDIRGPPRSSFLLGNMGDIRYQAEVGDVEFGWLREFGGAWKIHAPLGEERLMLADPKALQYVLQTSGYRFPQRPEIRADVRMVLGDGVAWAHGEQHQRQKKVMNPAFSVPQLKSFLPHFLRYANKLVQKIKEQELGNNQEAAFNIHTWLSRTTLDAIADVGFGLQFGVLDGSSNELTHVYENLFVDTTLYPSAWDLAFRALWKFFPPGVLWYLRYLPGRGFRRFRHYQDFVRDYGRKLIARTQVDKAGTSKDAMSVLMRANEAENPRLKLTEIEVVDQISTILLAGHDTTASSLTWWFYELSRHPDWQIRVRDEIRVGRRRVIERGDEEFTMTDLEDMSVMQATLKEAMRLHPIIWQAGRLAGQDDVIPLASPITTKSGQEITSIPIRKGQAIDIHIAAYNRNPDVWGADANEWNPERFMNATKAGTTSVGVYANLLNFSAGVKACMGWRFSVIEMQAIAATLLESFEFALPEQTEENIIRRKPSGLMAPMADGHMGIWMGLKVKYCGAS